MVSLAFLCSFSLSCFTASSAACSLYSDVTMGNGRGTIQIRRRYWSGDGMTRQAPTGMGASERSHFRKDTRLFRMSSDQSDRSDESDSLDRSAPSPTNRTSRTSQTSRTSRTSRTRGRPDVILASRTIVMVRPVRRFRETSQTDAPQKVAGRQLQNQDFPLAALWQLLVRSMKGDDALLGFCAVRRTR